MCWFVWNIFPTHRVSYDRLQTHALWYILEAPNYELFKRQNHRVSCPFWMGRRNWVSFSYSETQLFQLSDRLNPPNALYFVHQVHYTPFPTLDILTLSLINNLHWKLHISSLAKLSSPRLCVLFISTSFLLPHTCCSYTSPFWPSYGVHISCAGGSTHTALLNKVESVFSSHQLPTPY